MIRLYLITPPEGDPTEAVREALAALPAGVAGVQLRQQLPARELLERARTLKAICDARGAPLFVNDRADVALAAGATGVHLPGNGISAADARRLGVRFVGASVHAAAEIVASGADFCVFAPVFDTPGKKAQGLDALAKACSASPIPVLALGGVDETNARRCVDAGAHGVACIRSVLGAKNPAAAALRLWKALALAVLIGATGARANDSHSHGDPVGSRAAATEARRPGRGNPRCAGDAPCGVAGRARAAVAPPRKPARTPAGPQAGPSRRR